MNPSARPPSAAPEPTPAWQIEPATAEVIASAVGECSSVARLSPGVMGEVATYLVGHRVVGVRFREAVEVHVVARYGMPVERVAAEVRAAVAPLVAPPIDVYVDDVDVELDGLAVSGETAGGAGAPRR